MLEGQEASVEENFWRAQRRSLGVLGNKPECGEVIAQRWIGSLVEQGEKWRGEYVWSSTATIEIVVWDELYGGVMWKQTRYPRSQVDTLKQGSKQHNFKTHSQLPKNHLLSLKKTRFSSTNCKHFTSDEILSGDMIIFIGLCGWSSLHI